MADRIKGITIVLDGDAAKLTDVLQREIEETELELKSPTKECENFSFVSAQSIAASRC